jgi:predicted Zn finger-like uncharacterized protein
MRVYCPDCNTPRTVSDDRVGRRVRCRNCDRPFRAGARNEPLQREHEPDDIDLDRQRAAAWVVGSAVLLLVGLIVGGGLTGWYFLTTRPPACQADDFDPGELEWHGRPAGEPPEFDPLPEDPEE